VLLLVMWKFYYLCLIVCIVNIYSWQNMGPTTENDGKYLKINKFRVGFIKTVSIKKINKNGYL
jgi:hypothetical protein